MTLEPAARLHASPTRQVSTSFEARTIFDSNADRARDRARKRPRVTPAGLRAALQIGDTLVEVYRRSGPHVIARHTITRGPPHLLPTALP